MTYDVLCFVFCVSCFVFCALCLVHACVCARANVCAYAGVRAFVCTAASVRFVWRGVAKATKVAVALHTAFCELQDIIIYMCSCGLKKRFTLDTEHRKIKIVLAIG